jgi:cystathionine beta-lyase/cystathionine gamma-synthase
MSMAKQSKADKALDREIDKLYRENCANIAIDIFDIPKVFAEAKKARAEGRDMKEAIVSFVNNIRKN